MFVSHIEPLKSVPFWFKDPLKLILPTTLRLTKLPIVFKLLCITLLPIVVFEIISTLLIRYTEPEFTLILLATLTLPNTLRPLSTIISLTTFKFSKYVVPWTDNDVLLPEFSNLYTFTFPETAPIAKISPLLDRLTLYPICVVQPVVPPKIEAPIRTHLLLIYLYTFTIPPVPLLSFGPVPIDIIVPSLERLILYPI